MKNIKCRLSGTACCMLVAAALGCMSVLFAAAAVKVHRMKNNECSAENMKSDAGQENNNEKGDNNEFEK